MNITCDHCGRRVSIRDWNQPCYRVQSDRTVVRLCNVCAHRGALGDIVYYHYEFIKEPHNLLNDFRSERS